MLKNFPKLLQFLCRNFTMQLALTDLLPKSPE